MTRLSFLLLLLAAGTARTAEKPNVVVILSDDQGWGDIGIHGNTNLRTPHLDSIATAGARFPHFFVQPVCSPTRAEFLTGRCHPRTGVRNVTTGGERLNLDESTVADAFAAAGYATGAFGKWHNGTQYPYHPNGRGFGEFYGFTSGHWGDYFDAPMDHNGTPVRGKGYLADDITTHAIDFLAANRGKPFFCYLAFNTPHSPMQVPQPYWDRFKSKELKQRATAAKQEDIDKTRAALAMCENLDDNVGRVLAKLDELKLADNTVVVFFGDNGPNGHRWNGGAKGIKGSTDEGGVRSPLFVRWPGTIAAGRVCEIVAGAIDLLPTLCDLAGVKRVGTKPLDGVSLAPLLRGTATTLPPRHVVQHWNGKVGVRSQTHRLDAAGKLYDETADPGQTTDLSAKQPAVTAALRTAATAYRRDVLSELPAKDDRAFPVGHRAAPLTLLPARDGVPHGGIRRSAGAPNCSYFMAWTKPDQSLTWDIEVLTPGRYRAAIDYACAAKNLGATVTLALGDSAVSRKLDVANDPPARGAENDRVPRSGESLVKDFKPWAVGEFTLPAGRGLLTLKATAIPGAEVMEVRAVTLTLLEPTK
jgi:arylsulfatase A-like enzyme